MGIDSKIEWTNSTWNPWNGCTRVSAGCDNCYMMRSMARFGRDPEVVRRVSDRTFFAPLKWEDGQKVFTCSWADFFHPGADSFRNECWDIIKKRSGLTFQILTKRPERIALCLPKDWGRGYPNVWIGVSAENQEAANLRIPILLNTPAAIRFVSIEPMLGPVKLTSLSVVTQTINVNSKHRILCELAKYNALGWDLVNESLNRWGVDLPFLDWVIVGAETGSGARPINNSWVRNLRDECFQYGTALFVKSLGRRKEIPGDLAIKEFPPNELYRWDSNRDLTLNQIIEREKSKRRVIENELRSTVALLSETKIKELAFAIIPEILTAYPGIDSRGAQAMRKFARMRILADWRAEAMT